MQSYLNSMVFPTLQWYAVYCKPLKERLAARALNSNLGLSSYLPEVRRLCRGKIQQTPFFPRYLFVQANLQDVAVSHINAIPGVQKLVMFSGQPQPIPAHIVERFRQRLDTLNAVGGTVEHDFHPGDAVRLKDGPMQGLEAIFLGSAKPNERVKILINFLGSLRNAEVNVDTIERARSTMAPQRARRTRGKGRRIKYADAEVK